MSNNPAKYEVLIEQYLLSILDISGENTIGNTGRGKIQLPLPESSRYTNAK